MGADPTGSGNRALTLAEARQQLADDRRLGGLRGELQERLEVGNHPVRLLVSVVRLAPPEVRVGEVRLLREGFPRALRRTACSPGSARPGLESQDLSPEAG